MKNLFILFVGLFVFAMPLVALDKVAEPKPFTDDKEVNLMTLLAPPPANDSATTKAELDALFAIQNSRTKDQSDRGVADDKEEVWRFADVFADPNFNAAKLPIFTAFFDRVVATEPAVVDPAKDTFKRPRPHMIDSRINPLVKKKTSGAYPSGHVTIGTLMGILLSNMVPEKRAALMARAWEYGNNRMVVGIHYASDVEAGRLSGYAIAAVLATHSDFNQEFASAKAELRTVLGLK